MKLTKATLDKLVLPSGKTERIVFDEGMPGFGLRIRAGGKRTWIVQFRIGTKQRRVALGTVERVDPDEARKRAKEALAHVSLGRDPQTEKAKVKARASATLGSIVPKYLAYAEPRQRPGHHGDTKRYLERAWSSLARVGIDDIDRAAVSVGLSRIKVENGPYAANRARAALSAFYSWAIGEGLAHQNPVVGTHKPIDEVSRDRVLTDEELGLVWTHAGPGDFRVIVRLLILTAARAMEIAGMRWDEITGDLLRIGVQRSKNRQANELPLSPQAMAIMTALPRRDDRDLVFGRGAGPFSGWSSSKAALDERILAEIRERHGARAVLPPWRIHDLRRTAATRMADLSVQPHVIEAILGHVSGHKAGVAGVYNRASYAAEKRAALKLWGDHVENMVAG